MSIRVVVADDFPLVREGVVRALNADPAIEVVGQAENGQEALELAERLRPDVMILDLRMPDLGGLAVLDKLRTTRRGSLIVRPQRAGQGLPMDRGGAADTSPSSARRRAAPAVSTLRRRFVITP